MEAQTLRIPEVAKLLNIGQTACRAAIKRGEIPSLKIGGLILVPRGALDEMLQAASNGLGGERGRGNVYAEK